METPNAGGAASTGSADSSVPLVYVVAQNEPTGSADNEIDLFKLWDTVWRGRWLIIGISAVFALGSGVYALLQPPLYSANVVLAPVKEDPLSGLAGQLGGLASLAGIGATATDNVEAIAVLRSRDFARMFIEENNLMPMLFPDAWDAAASRWTVDPAPSSFQAARYFIRFVRRVDEDARTGLVTLSFEWRDPQLVAEWANRFATRLNEHMRQRAFKEAEANVAYLRGQFEATALVALQQSISGLLETEMQKLMLARGNEEYAFRVIDRAEVPNAKSKPRVVLIIGLATAFGAMLAVFLVFVLDMIRSRVGAGSLAAGAPGARR